MANLLVKVLADGKHATRRANDSATAQIETWHEQVTMTVGRDGAFEVARGPKGQPATEVLARGTLDASPRRLT